jgi:isocitrate dehydrogenase
MKEQLINYCNDILEVPDQPVILFIKGDGIGPEIWEASQKVIDRAVEKAYGGSRKIIWKEVLAGETAFKETGEWLPEETLAMIDKYKIAIKGPLTTPVGGGIRSINVALRQKFSLYSCIRPVKYFPGVPSPAKAPENVDMVIFRENMEDLYSGIEWKAGSPDAVKVLEFLNREMSQKIDVDSGVGVKPISAKNSKNLFRSAIKHAIENKRRSVTIMHKGNIMKFTEGAFRDWGYEVAAEEFSDATITEKELGEKYNWNQPADKIVIKDRIADALFQEIIIRPQHYDIIAAPNLNGDYISDALAALVGGLGIAPGANIGENHAIFEATHGTAPDIAGKNMANPGSLILSGEMMLKFLKWDEAAHLVMEGFSETIKQKKVTCDLASQMNDAVEQSCSEFGAAVADNIK